MRFLNEQQVQQQSAMLVQKYSVSSAASGSGSQRDADAALADKLLKPALNRLQQTLSVWDLLEELADGRYMLTFIRKTMTCEILLLHYFNSLI